MEGKLLGVADALHRTKYFTLGSLDLIVGTDHMPLLGLLANKHLDAIDNPHLVNLKQKILGWQFWVVYILGKLLGGTDALSRYGVCHCSEDENVQALRHNSEPSVRQHLVGLLAVASNEDNTPPTPC